MPWGAGMAGMAGMGSYGSVVSQPGVPSIAQLCRAALFWTITAFESLSPGISGSGGSSTVPSVSRSLHYFKPSFWIFEPNIAGFEGKAWQGHNTLIAAKSLTRPCKQNGKCVQDFTPASITSATDWPWDHRIWQEECWEDWLIMTKSLQDMSQILQHRSFLAGLRYPHFGTANGIMRRGPHQSSTLTQSHSEL